ncbi:MAG: GIY-YIG nuclease family protein [Candidatus Omnitrophota bacterium]
MHSVYFLTSQKNKRYLYVGLTNSLQRRLKEHNSKESKLATAPYRPLDLAGYVAVKDKRIGEELEKYFKTGSGKAFLKKRILPDEAPSTSND